MKSSRSGKGNARIKSARNRTVPLRSATTTRSRPAKSEVSWDAREVIRVLSCLSEMSKDATSPAHPGGTGREWLTTGIGSDRFTQSLDFPSPKGFDTSVPKQGGIPAGGAALWVRLHVTQVVDGKWALPGINGILLYARASGQNGGCQNQPAQTEETSASCPRRKMPVGAHGAIISKVDRFSNRRISFCAGELPTKVRGWDLISP